MLQLNIKKQNMLTVIFTDLDGTLLDHNSYGWEKAGPALSLCQKTGVPVILVSSKTGAEISKLHDAMDLETPFVSENGGGIFFPKDFFEGNPGKDFIKKGEMWKLELGTSYRTLVRELEETGKELGVTLRGFSNMTLSEVSELTGLSEESTLPALSREFDEPFIVQGGDVDVSDLERSASKRKLRISQGGRFFHLHGDNDKGEAVKRLISIYTEKYGRVFAIALGDSPNDFDMFNWVDQPVLVRSDKYFPDLKTRFPGIIITDKPGPEGWNSTVLNLLS